MNHRDRAAPIALPRDAPIAQAVLNLARSRRLALELGLDETVGDGLLRGGDVEAVEKARIDHDTVAGIGLRDRECLGIFTRRQPDGKGGEDVSARGLEDAVLIRGADAES